MSSAFRATVRTPGAPAHGEPDGGDARRVYFERLARVSLRHGYYRATGGVCLDFSARPTGHTAALMRSLGMLFRAEADGFSVLYNRLRRRQLLDFLEHDRNQSGQAWTRLCFVLSSRNPWFVSFTAIPIDLNPARSNLYLTNRQAHVEEADVVILPPGNRVTGAERVPVTGGRFEEIVGPKVESVSLLAVSGEEIVTKPRCVPVDPGSPPRVECVDRLFFDLTGLPEEKYYVQTAWNNGDEPSTGEYLYTASTPIPLCFVELLFSDPTVPDPAPQPRGVYPVRDLGLPTERIEAVSYEVPFAARRTWWSYYVVAAIADAGRGELRIRQVRARGEARVAFRGPCCVRMEGGRRAWRFVSNRPLALEQRSPLHLQLLWRDERSGRSDVLMDRMPLASGQQVLPLRRDEACRRARSSLCLGSPGRRCRRLLDSLCEESPPGPPRRNFSDIYVYV